MWGLGYLSLHAGFRPQVTTSEASANRPVTGARRALKTWRMTRWRQPGFCSPDWTLPQIRSAFEVLVRAGGLLPSPFHAFRAPLLRSLCQAAASHQLSKELFDSEYELSKAGYAANEVNDIGVSKAEERNHRSSPSLNAKWDEYAKARAVAAKDKKWFRHPGIDVQGRSAVTIPSGLTCGAFMSTIRANVRASKAPAARDIWRA